MIELTLDDSKLFFNISNFQDIPPHEYKILKDSLYVLTDNYRLFTFSKNWRFFIM